MSSYIERQDSNQEYVAVLNASKCKTFSGFRKELVKSFSLPEIASDNLNDINGYIFSNWLGFKKIKIVLGNSGSLKKDNSHFNKLISILETWKKHWESLDRNNTFIIEIS